MSRARLLYLLSLLETDTNESCALSLQELCRRLFLRHPEESCSEQQVRKDLSLLQALSDERALPFHLEVEHGPRNCSRYRLYYPGFGLNEARMVFDPVSISQFLTQSQKNALLSRLEGFLSHGEVQQLKQRVRPRPCLTSGDSLLETLRVLYQAISDHTCLRFRYMKFDLSGTLRPQRSYRRIRPIRVVWEGEHYYLVALNPEHPPQEQQRHYRVDRMEQVEADDGTWVPVDAASLSRGQFDMFSARETRLVRFRVRRSLLDMVFETFGTSILCRPDPSDPDWVIFSAQVELSGGFDRWVLRQTDCLEVLDPPEVRSRIQDLLRRTLALYGK